MCILESCSTVVSKEVEVDIGRIVDKVASELQFHSLAANLI